MENSVLKAEGVFQWYEPSTANTDSKRVKVTGTLEIAENGLATLAIVGLLPDSGSTQFTLRQQEIEEDKWIVGILKDSRYVFLGHLWTRSTTWGQVMSHQDFFAGRCLLFDRLEKLPDLTKAGKVQISLESLGQWASDAAVKVSTTARSVTARAARPKVHTYQLPGRTLRLKTDIRASMPSDWSCHSVTIKQETFFEIQPKKPQNLDEVNYDFDLLEDIILLLTDVDVELPWPTVTFGNVTGTFYFERRKTIANKVDILKSWATMAGLTKNGNDFGLILNNLIQQQEILGPGLHLYLGIRRGESLYLENKFTTAIFGLESLHRRVGTHQGESGLEEKIQRIIGDIKLPKDQKWLSKRLKNAGEPTLEERLFATFSELKIGLDAKTVRAFAADCSRIRNAVAHFGGQRDGSYDEFTQKMFILNAAVRPLYHAVLLSRIGLPDEFIAKHFHRSVSSGRLKRILQDAGLKFEAPTATETIDMQRPVPNVEELLTQISEK